MRYMWLATFGLALGVWLPPAGAAAETTAAWGSLTSLATGRPMVAPAGWLNYCMAALARCLQTSPATMIEPTPAVLALVERVQREVNARIQPRAEPAGLDLWQLAVTS